MQDLCFIIVLNNILHHHLLGIWLKTSKELVTAKAATDMIMAAMQIAE